LKLVTGVFWKEEKTIIPHYGQKIQILNFLLRILQVKQARGKLQ
jgi:hypothetical protein